MKAEFANMVTATKDARLLIQQLRSLVPVGDKDSPFYLEPDFYTMLKNVQDAVVSEHAKQRRGMEPKSQFYIYTGLFPNLIEVWKVGNPDKRIAKFTF